MIKTICILDRLENTMYPVDSSIEESQEWIDENQEILEDGDLRFIIKEEECLLI